MENPPPLLKKLAGQSLTLIKRKQQQFHFLSLEKLEGKDFLGCDNQIGAGSSPWLQGTSPDHRKIQGLDASEAIGED